MAHLTEEEKRLVKTHVQNVGFRVNDIWTVHVGVVGKGL